MTINQRILQGVDLNKNIKLIEVSKIAMREITIETLDKLQAKGIELEAVDTLKDLQCYTYKTDCFAYHNKQCGALADIDCVNCRFYKNKSKVNMWQIEEDIKKYARNCN